MYNFFFTLYLPFSKVNLYENGFKERNTYEYYGMVNYSKGLIYKLCCNENDVKDIYVGSTTNFIRRKCSHKSSCTNPNDKAYNYEVYKFIRDNGGWSNWSMILVREYKTSDKLKLKRKERKYIYKLGATLNCSIPTRTKSEWYEENKSDIRKIQKEYYEENKSDIRKIQKEYYEENKHYFEKYSKLYRDTNKLDIQKVKKEYYERNKESIKEHQKQYNERNKDAINLHRNERIQCECGCIISRRNIARHQKAPKHIQLINQ